MTIELRHIRYFLALADELHFGRAASRVHITQPPFSKQIKELEDQLRVQLFNRTKRRVVLTEPGKVFLGYANQLFALLATAFETTRRAELGEVGRLAIGYTGTADNTVLPTVLRHFRAAHADVEIALHEMIPQQQRDALEKREIDVGFMKPPQSVRHFSSEVLLRDPLVLAVPTDHSLARRDSIEVRQLRSEAFIMLPHREGEGLHREVSDLCQRMNLQPRIVHVATQLRSIISLVSAGIGISIVPLSARRSNIGNVVFKKLRVPECYTELAVVWRRGEENQALLNFLRAARQAVRAVRNTTRTRPISG